MKFQIDKNSTQFAQLITLPIFSFLAILFVVLRFVASRRTQRKLGFEDWMAVAATVFAVLSNLFSLLAIGVLNGRQIIDEIREAPQDYTIMRKYDIVSIYMFFGHMWTVKLAILALYRRIFGKKRSYRIAIDTLIVAVSVWTTLFIILQGFQCRPLARYWNLAVPGRCWPEVTIVFGGAVGDTLLDFACVILAMVMIRPLQTSKQLKWRLRFLFGVGFLVGITGVIKMGVTYSTDPIFALSMIAIWSAVQTCLSVLCACAPVYQSILPSVEGWSRLLSKITGSNLGRTSRKSISTGGNNSSQEITPKAGTEHTEDEVVSYSSPADFKWAPADHNHDCNVYALPDLRPTDEAADTPGIHVRRDFSVRSIRR